MNSGKEICPKKETKKIPKVKSKKRFFELSGPIGTKHVRARTVDEARGVYKALYNSLKLCDSDFCLDSVKIVAESEFPRSPYLVIGGKRKGVFVALRYPKAV